MKILVISASPNEPSNSDFLADRFIEGIQGSAGSLPAKEVEVKKICLKDMKLEHFSVKHYELNTDQGEDFRIFQQYMEECDGFVVATPVWNFGVPASLKNLIDHMGSFALDENHSRGMLKGKPFFCIFTGGAPAPAWKGMMQKTTSFVPEGLKYFRASYIGHHFEGKCTAGRGKFDLVVDQRPDSIVVIKKKGAEFAKVVEEFMRTGKAPFKHRAKAKMAKTAERVLKKLF